MAGATSKTDPCTTATTTTTTDGNENDFQNTSRVGRRNALPDILNEDGTTTPADLPEKLSALTTNDPSECSKSVSKSDATGSTASPLHK
ncbi:hypothetical protein HA402_004176 [Bradysia odoriphaga]|nr:hypothetical protein HA402_004176 [Bradysia odoriphaga]